MSALLMRTARRLLGALLLLGLSAPLANAVDYTTTYRWDLNRRLEMTISADTGTGVRIATKNTYNGDGQITKIEKGTTTSTTGSPFTVLETTTIEYDAVGNKIKQTTPAGVTQFTYDDDDKLICSALRMNEDEYGSLTTDACALDTTGDVGEDRITKITYDAAGQKLIETRGYGTSVQQDYVELSYTDNGKLAWSEDANDNRTGYTYDGFDRLTKMTFPSTTTDHAVNASDYEQYGYDAGGNRTSLRKRSGETIGYAFDALNRETVKNIPGGTSEDVYTAYDLLNRKLSARFVSTSGNGIVYTYDKAGRVMSETTYGRALAFQHDTAGNRTRITYPDSFYVDYTYDALSRMNQVRENGATSGAGLLASYTYDSLGRRDLLTRGNSASTDLSYDSASRLSSLAQDLSGSTADVTLSFVYSPASQILTRGITNASYHWSSATSVNATYVPDGLNRYSTVGGVTYTYDARGNLTGDGTRAFTYDLENRLLDVDTSSVQTLALSYDPNGRLKETVSPTITTQFLYDGDRLVAEYDGSTLLRRYVHGPGVDEPLVWYDGSGTSTRKWLIADNQGSVIAETDSSGAMAQQHRYDAYGQPQDVNWNTGSRFRYTGQIALIEAQLYHYKARVYDPTIGRFLQTDPIGYKDDYNLYSYVRGDPVNRRDPTGTYGRGEGFSDAEWRQFDKLQKTTASSMENRAADLEKKAAKLDEKGKPGGDAMRGKAESLRGGAAALRSDGSDGRLAHVVTQKQYSDMGGSKDGVARANIGGPNIYLNRGKDAIWLGTTSEANWTVAHESLHTFGLRDQRLNGVIAYKNGTSEQQKAFSAMKGTAQSLINPDHLVDEVY